MYYNPFANGDEYLGGLDYGLTNGGHLSALDAVVDTYNSFYLPMPLGTTLTFDYWFYTETNEPYTGQIGDILTIQETGDWICLTSTIFPFSDN